LLEAVAKILVGCVSSTSDTLAGLVNIIGAGFLSFLRFALGFFGNKGIGLVAHL